MKIANLKSMILKGAAVGLLAGAFALAAPAKADAQVVVGVVFGHPHYAYGYAPRYYAPRVYAPGYYAPGYYGWHRPVYHNDYRRRW
jgi:hypothetical protein